MQKIHVQFRGWGQSWRLGELGENGSQVIFEYADEACSKGIELSKLRMPLGKGSYSGFPREQLQLPGLIADSLPDGWGLLLMDRDFRKTLNKEAHQISAIDRLAYIGDRAMGALSFAPATDVVHDAEDIKLLHLSNEIQKVIADKDTSALKQLILVGGSPHGARPKALVQYDKHTQVISTLPDAPGKAWLIKFPGKSEHKEVCAIEHLYAELARLCGLDMPDTQYFDLGPRQAAFGIERFDRFDGLRVPIHTLAGALNINFRIPNTSYQTLLRTTRALTLSEVEVRKAFERCVFNVIFNNRDDHTKNFSFRMNKSMQWELAPCYDLTYSPGPGGYHQMDIGGEGLNPASKHLLNLAANDEIDSTWAENVIEKMVSVASNFKNISSDFTVRPATKRAISIAINRNCQRMA